MASPARSKKLFDKIRQKRCKNVRFDELCSLLEKHGWILHTIARNSHYIYVHTNYEGTVNVPKPHPGPDVKPFYCRRALSAIEEVAGYDE